MEDIINNSSFDERIKKSFYFEQGHLETHLRKIKIEQDPRVFKELMLSSFQLYLNGLLKENQERDPETLDKRLGISNSFLKSLRVIISEFYGQNQCIDIDSIRERIIPHYSSIIKYDSKEISKTRHIIGGELNIRKCAFDIFRGLNNKKIDLVLPIASSGVEPGILIADYLGVDDLLPVRYSRYNQYDKDILTPYSGLEVREQICGKNILIVDDTISSGYTASKVIKWAKRYYSPGEIYFASIYSFCKPENCMRYKDVKFLYKHNLKKVL